MGDLLLRRLQSEVERGGCMPGELRRPELLGGSAARRVPSTQHGSDPLKAIVPHSDRASRVRGRERSQVGVGRDSEQRLQVGERR